MTKLSKSGAEAACQALKNWDPRWSISFNWYCTSFSVPNDDWKNSPLSDECKKRPGG